MVMSIVFNVRRNFFLGFLEGITPTSKDKIQVKEFTLMELKKPATYGAAYLGAKRANVNIKVRRFQFVISCDVTISYSYGNSVFFSSHSRLLGSRTIFRQSQYFCTLLKCVCKSS